MLEGNDAVSKAYGNVELVPLTFIIDRQGNIAQCRTAVLPAHLTMLIKILPAVGDTGVTCTAGGKGILLLCIGCGQRQTEWPLLRPQHLPSTMITHLCHIVFAGSAQMRSQQNIRMKLCITFQHQFEQNHVTIRLRHDTLSESKLGVFMHDSDRRHTRRMILHFTILQGFDLNPEAFAIGYDETHIPYLRDIDSRIINFIENTLTDGKPDA